MIIQLSSNEQLIGGEPFVQLRHGELCPDFNVSVCPKVVEMAMPKDGKLPIRFCLPNERHWGRWRQEALQLIGDLVNTCDNERDLFQAICELAEQELDAKAIWHWQAVGLLAEEEVATSAIQPPLWRRYLTLLLSALLLALLIVFDG